MKKNSLEDAREVLKQEATALTKASERLGESFIRTVDSILESRGKVIVTGVGKSGIVARKIAATLSSLGTGAVFVHPTEAFHGDLGIISPNDVCIAISNSGATDELLKLLPSLRLLGVKLVAICSASNNDLAKEADIVIETGVEREACSLNLAPTTSTTVAMAIGDAIAVALVRAKGFTERDFAFFHPGGTLGRKLLTRVEDLMIPREQIGTGFESDTIKTLAERMSQSNLGLVVVLTSQGHVAGIVTDGDLRRAYQKTDLASLTAKQVMNAKPKCIEKYRLVTEAVRLAEKHRVTALIVTDEQGEFKGAVNLHDLIREKVV